MSATKLPRNQVREDYYPTPASVTRALLPLLPIGYIFDPCAGKGEILSVASASGRVVRGYEINAERADEAERAGFDVYVCDSLWTAWPADAAAYVFNPPFSLAFNFVRRAVAQARDHGITVAALLRVGFFEAKCRAEWNLVNPCDVYVICPRPRFVHGKSDSAAYAWCLWAPGRGGRFGILQH